MFVAAIQNTRTLAWSAPTSPSGQSSGSSSGSLTPTRPPVGRQRPVLGASGLAAQAAVAAPRPEAWCAAYGPGGNEEWGRADVEEHLRDAHSTFTWLLEAMIDLSGFTIERASTPTTVCPLRTCSRRPTPEVDAVAHSDPLGRLAS